MKILIRYVTVFAVSMLSLWYFEVDYCFTDLKDFFFFLLGISAMVFTIMGIWIALIYPEALMRLASSDAKAINFFHANKDLERLEAIVLSILKSGLVVIFAMILYFVKIIIIHTPFYPEYQFVIKTVFLSLSVFLAYIQLEAVWHVVTSNIAFINDLHKIRIKKKGDADI